MNLKLSDLPDAYQKVNERPQMQKFTLPYPPSANKLWRMWKGRMLLSRAGREYKQAVGMIVLIAGARREDECDVHLNLVVYRPRKVGDLDNTLKAVLDGLKGCVFEDDKQVVSINAVRRDDALNPRVEVLVTFE